MGCGTPTASANCDALTACGPTRRFTTRALNAALYSGMSPSTSTSTLCTMPYANAPVMQQQFRHRGAVLASLPAAVAAGEGDRPVLFPAHPRTAKVLAQLPALPSGLRVVDPQPDLEFVHLVRHTRALVTDSGGITEETTVLGIPCLTLRDTTERPETVTVGTNELIGTDPAALAPAYALLNAGGWKKGAVPELWDGKTGERIAAPLEGVLADYI